MRQFSAIGYFCDHFSLVAIAHKHIIVMIISSNQLYSVCYLLLACFVQKLHVLATGAVRPDCKLEQHFSSDVHGSY